MKQKLTLLFIMMLMCISAAFAQKVTSFESNVLSTYDDAKGSKGAKGKMM